MFKSCDWVAELRVHMLGLIWLIYLNQVCECNKEIAAAVIDIISMDLASASYELVGYRDWMYLCECMYSCG